ncbi:MAG: M20/M25/M40 family metallo-hydrolase [Candidatus Hodarchaeales archaeon]
MDKLNQELKELLLDLIRIDTSDGTIDAVKLIKGFFIDNRIDAKLQIIDKKDANVIATLSPDSGVKGNDIVLSGHLDVVPPGNLAKWKVCSPFDPVEKDNRIYGYGSADMKGGVVTLIGSCIIRKN